MSLLPLGLYFLKANSIPVVTSLSNLVSPVPPEPRFLTKVKFLINV